MSGNEKPIEMRVRRVPGMTERLKSRYWPLFQSEERVYNKTTPTIVYAAILQIYSMV